MRKPRQDGQETRRRVLEAAGQLFAQKGFRDATVAEICRLAGTNVASVNYYFQSKEALYIESWKHAYQVASGSYPIDGGVPADAPPEERLRGHIDSLVRRVLDEGSYSIDISNQELIHPTGLISELKHGAMREIFDRLAVVLRELLGDDATERDVQFCRRSIMAQCYGHLVLRRLRWSASSPEKAAEMIRQDKAMYATHVFNFSLAGIREMKRQIAARGAKKHD